MTSLHQNIRRLRDAAKLTSSEAAKRAGISQGTWSDIERGKNANPTPRTLGKIAASLGVTVDKLWVDKDGRSVTTYSLYALSGNALQLVVELNTTSPANESDIDAAPLKELEKTGLAFRRDASVGLTIAGSACAQDLIDEGLFVGEDGESVTLPITVRMLKRKLDKMGTQEQARLQEECEARGGCRFRPVEPVAVKLKYCPDCLAVDYTDSERAGESVTL